MSAFCGFICKYNLFECAQMKIILIDTQLVTHLFEK